MSAFFARGAVPGMAQTKVDALVETQPTAELATRQMPPPLIDGAERALASESSKGLLYSEDGEENFETLGDLLVYLRQTYGLRTQHTGEQFPHIKLTAQAIAAFLNDHDYSMTSGSYSLLEQGKTLPKNPERFLEIVSTCLAVPRSSKYWPLLRFTYLYDHACRYVGKDFARDHFPHGKQVLCLLRSGAL